MWMIMARVSGGVTGTRESVVKNRGGVIRFDRKEDAQAEADRYMKAMNHEFRTADFRYWVVPADEVL